MATVTQPLRDEHKELIPHVETLKAAGDAIHEVLNPLDLELVHKATTFLTHHLLPHAKAEEMALYPVVRKVMGAEEGTLTMSQDHQEVERLTQELLLLQSKISGTNISEYQAADLRRVLYGLYAIVKLHFAKEEDVYLPLLDAHLTPEHAQEMFAAMDTAAHAAKAHLQEE